MRDDTLLCAHAGLFDKTSVLVMRSSKNPGRELDACSVEVVPQVTKVRGSSPGGGVGKHQESQIASKMLV